MILSFFDLNFFILLTVTMEKGNTILQKFILHRRFNFNQFSLQGRAGVLFNRW